MKKKVISVLLCAAMAASVLAGCAGTTASAPAADAAPAATEEAATEEAAPAEAAVLLQEFFLYNLPSDKHPIQA